MGSLTNENEGEEEEDVMRSVTNERGKKIEEGEDGTDEECNELRGDK